MMRLLMALRQEEHEREANVERDGLYYNAIL